MSITVGDYNWVSHTIRNTEGDNLLNLTENELICRYWQRTFEEFQEKILSADNLVNVGSGEYRILYSSSEVRETGPFISIIYSGNSDIEFYPSMVVDTAVSTVSGTCVVTGQFIDFEGQNLTFPVEMVVENLYNPIYTTAGSVIQPSEKYYSDIDGYLELRLIKGMRLRVCIDRYGIVATVTIPEQDCIDIADLLELAENEYEPR